MDFFSTSDYKKTLYRWITVSVILSAVLLFANWKYGVLAFFLCAGFTTAHLISDYKKYQRISKMSDEINKILHDSSKFDLAQFEEGELSVLNSEIHKMTVRLREQADRLKKDKTYLANSIADISHQIRTPLTSIHLIANFLSEDNLNENRRKLLIKELLQLLARIDWQINTLLKISKLDAGVVKLKKETVNVAELIRKSTESIAIPMDLRDQKLSVFASGEESFIGDLSWTREAIENILKNCMEHTPAGGQLTIRVENTLVFTEIEISDNGEGIDPKDLPHIFERFYKGKHSDSNSVGIGLALARMIITAQNGTIRAGQSPDGGARFQIRFYKSII